MRSILSSVGVRFAVALLMLPPLVGGQAAPAAAATTVCKASAISGGGQWATAISNGQVFTWGRNVEGELGLGFQSTQVPTPTAVKSNPLLTNVSGIWAGLATAYAVDPSGQLWSWGSDINSQRGYGNPLYTLFTSSPAQVIGPTNVVAVGAAYDHAVVATSDGTVWGWGQSSGLGVGDTFFNQDAPIILSAPPHVVRVASGFRYSLLLTSSGTVYASGGNLFGQLGLPGVQFAPAFQSVPGLSGVVDIATSPLAGFSLALDGSGHVFAFGSNSGGQLANGTYGPPNTLTPTQIAGLDSVIQVSAGADFALALKSDATVWAWGNQSFGAVGIGSVSAHLTPYVTVPTQVIFPAGTQIVRVAAGLEHSMAIDAAGNIWVWGEDSLGALGTGVVGQNQLTPVKITLAAICPGLPPPPTVATVASLSPSFGAAEGSTQVTIVGSGFTGATEVQFGDGQALLQPCASSTTLFCFTVLDDSHITVKAPPHPPGNVDVFVDNIAGISATVQGDVYSYEGWVSPTPSDRTAFDVPIAHSASFTVKALEQGAMTIGHTILPPFMQCTDTANPGQPAQVDCTVAPTRIGLFAVTFFDATTPSRVTTRTFLVGHGGYSALGDSFAAGDGNSPYIVAGGYDSGADGCHRSYFAYPRIVSNFFYAGGEKFVACSGAVIQQIVIGKGGELAQLDALSPTDDLVTIMVGGDDIGFGTIARLCITLVFGCEFDISTSGNQSPNSSIPRIGNEANAGQILTSDVVAQHPHSDDPIYTLDNIYATIRAKAPNARILVVGYPDLLPSPSLSSCPSNLLAFDEIAWLDGVEKYLNDTIAFEAARNGAEYVDLSHAFVNHELCTLDPYVNPLFTILFTTPIHPNEVGQGKMAAAVMAQINTRPLASQFLVGLGQVVTTTATVTSGMGQMTFTTNWPGSDVVTTLVSPSGRHITRTTVSGDVYHLLGPTYEVFSIANPEPGVWTVKMQGADVSADGETVSLRTVQLPHVNAPPTASITTSVTNGTAPLTVAFDASGSADTDGTVTGYSWDFGDGTTGGGVTTSHTFTRPGTFAVHLTVTDDGGATGFATASILVREPTVLTYNGSTTGDFNDSALLSATMTSELTGQPIPGAQVKLTIAGSGGNQGCVATTDSSGIASCYPTIALPSGAYTVTATFDQTDQLAGATSSVPFTVTAEEARLIYIGPPAAAGGSPATLSAVLAEDGLTPVAGRTVTFTLGSDGSAQSCSATTSASGIASCSIAVTQALGPTALTITFAGDTFYGATATSSAVVVFGYATGGAFVVGDRTSGSVEVGGHVTFWGSRWKSANTLSGGPTPGDFDGFENSAAVPVCGVNWTGDPANSGDPPASVPDYMAVIVSSTVTRSGSTLTGDVAHIVIVRVAAGYANDPGHPGTGTIVAVIC